MLLVEEVGKTFYCPLKSNRQVDDSGGQRVPIGEWTLSIGASRSY